MKTVKCKKGGNEMKTVTYKFCSGKSKIIEVEDCWAEAIFELNRRDHNNQRTETRYHKAYSEWIDGLEDKNIVEETVLRREQNKMLEYVLAKLKPEQSALLREIYIQGVKMAEIARRLGISEVAVLHRRDRALAKLKKFLENI